MEAANGRRILSSIQQGTTNKSARQKRLTTRVFGIISSCSGMAGIILAAPSAVSYRDLITERPPAVRTTDFAATTTVYRRPRKSELPIGSPVPGVTQGDEVRLGGHYFRPQLSESKRLARSRRFQSKTRKFFFREKNSCRRLHR